MRDWVNEWLFPDSFFYLVVQMRSCKSWKSCTAAFTLLCKPRSGFRSQMECEKGRKALKHGLAWSECEIQYGAEVWMKYSQRRAGQGAPSWSFLPAILWGGRQEGKSYQPAYTKRPYCTSNYTIKDSSCRIDPSICICYCSLMSNLKIMKVMLLANFLPWELRIFIFSH